VLAALLFMAIVIPVTVEALHVASMSGEVASRRAEAGRVADKVLNESIVTTNWTGAGLEGQVIEGGHDFHWRLSNEPWQPDSTMLMLTAEVTFTASGQDYSVHMNTLVPSPTALPAAPAAPATTGMQ
jgi:hypothetical protein